MLIEVHKFYFIITYCNQFSSLTYCDNDLEILYHACLHLYLHKAKLCYIHVLKVTYLLLLYLEFANCRPCQN